MCMLGRHTKRVRQQVEDILKACPGQNLTIGLSLDGVGEEHDRLRVMPGLFKHLVNTFNELAELKKEYPNLYITAGTTVTGLNYKTAAHTSTWAWENLEIDSLKPILVRGATTKDDAAWDVECFNGYMDILEQSRVEQKNRRRNKRTFFTTIVDAKETVQRELITEIFTTKKSPVVCSGARETAVIGPNGDVMGCEMRKDVFGNLRDADMDFRSLWLGENADRFRETINQVDECKGCYHHCFLSPPIFRSPKLWGRLAKSTVDAVHNNRAVGS